jgi:DNA-binding response OmpR family regulator
MNPPPSAILLDIMIPKKDGAAVLRDIRANTLFDNIPVVILTNSLHTEDAEKFLSLGADLYLIKMDNQSKEIVEKVEALINKGRTK